MKFKNNFEELKYKFNEIGGFNTGIIKNYSIYEKAVDGGSGLNIVTGSMPQYTKILISEDHNVSYHISGYGLSLQEAYIRFIGECTERYASVISHKYLSDFLVKGSYDELKKQYKYIMEPEKHLFLKSEQLLTMSQYNNDFQKENLKNTDSLTWVIANSIKCPGEKVLVPASQFFVGHSDCKVTTPSFTTGCACHETKVKAMINSLIEYIQIDAFMYHWYTDTAKFIINLEDAPLHLKIAIEKSLGDYKDDYDIVIMDYSDVAKVKIPIIGVFVIAKNSDKFPAISFGVQGGTDLETTIYRGVQEALAVVEMNAYVPFNNPQFLEKARSADHPFFDLDTNVTYFALSEFKENNYDFIMKHVQGEKTYSEFNKEVVNLAKYSPEKQVDWLCKSINKFSELACYLDITPPPLKNPELNVMRVFIPELLHMSFPKFPYLAHERYKEGEVTFENYIHPLP